MRALNRQKRLIPSTHILMAFMNKGLTFADAVSEMIDNSFADSAGGTEFTAIITDNRVTFVDNGKGVSDLNMIFGAGYSASRSIATDIGEFGIGSKDAQMYFGTKVTAHTVFKDKYYTYNIDWKQVFESEDDFGWPKEFDGMPSPMSKCPPAIRNGGTMIVISDLVKRQRINMEVSAKRLAHRYRPGLLTGKKITLVDSRSGKGASYNLTPSLAAQGIRSGTNVNGVAAGRKFKVMYTALKEYDPTLSGVHFGFGYRFMVQTSTIGDHNVSLPGRLYAEVMLSPDWKGCFGPNKTKIVKYYAELCAAVLEILKDWIKKLSAHAEQVRIEHVNLALKTDFSNILMLNRNTTGDHQEAGCTEVSEHGKDPKPVKPKPHIKAELAKPGEKDKGHAAPERKSRSGGISFSRDDTLGEFLASRHELNGNRLIIHLNGKIDQIAAAYEMLKPVGLWPTIAREFANFARARAGTADIDRVLPGFLDALNAMGYEVSVEYPDNLADKVFAYILKQAPLGSKERAIVRGLRTVTGRDEHEAMAS